PRSWKVISLAAFRVLRCRRAITNLRVAPYPKKVAESPSAFVIGHHARLQPPGLISPDRNDPEQSRRAASQPLRPVSYGRKTRQPSATTAARPNHRYRIHRECGCTSSGPPWINVLVLTFSKLCTDSFT